MTSRTNFPHTVYALRVEQPLGVFYIASLPASLLLDVTFSDTLRAEYSEGEQAYRLDGTQRLQQAKRLDAIASYIERTDASFPNAIILAANSRPEQQDQELNGSENAEIDDELDWTVEEGEDGLCKLTIPSSVKMAAIIDGQHRLFAFAKAADRLLDMQLVCSIFLDIPKPFQAQLFATINSTQKPVDRSLTYELFGYNILDEDPPFWTPDKLAVFLTRKLGTEDESPLKGRIVIAPKKDRILEALTSGGSWKVSTAVVVDGIMKLYSSNPKRDTTNMLQGESHPRSYISTMRKDNSPLRELYLSGNDAVIHQIVLNFLKACESTFWQKASPRSFIKKTVGVQALFDVLRKIIPVVLERKDLRVATFEKMLEPAADIDFSDTEYQNASGSGRSLIARAIRHAIGFD